MRIMLLTYIYLSTITLALSQEHNLTVVLTDIEKIEGHIQIGLYNDAATFPKVEEQYKVAYYKVEKNPSSYTFENLREGAYAIAVYHDLNSDKICNQNFIGIPKEAYGFSRNFRPFLKVPTFDQTKFFLNSDQNIVIKLE